jgi:hypothetical protein
MSEKETDPKKRIEICRKCPLYIKNIGMCYVCKCFMAVKTRISYFDCPRGKWVKEEDD